MRSMPCRLLFLACLLLFARPADAGEVRLGYGQAASRAQIAGWDIDVRGQDGKGLPPGSGSVTEGETLFAAQCAGYHGDFGEGKARYPALIGGRGSLATSAPVRTVTSYWPYAPTLFDYIRRTMPYAAPQTLSADQVYALVAYILSSNDLLPADARLDAARLAAVRMPNRNGFDTGDPRPDVRNQACMQNCRDAPPRLLSVAPRHLEGVPGEQ